MEKMMSVVGKVFIVLAMIMIALWMVGMVYYGWCHIHGCDVPYPNVIELFGKDGYYSGSSVQETIQNLIGKL